MVVGPTGDIWFTDPPYGITEAREGHLGRREYGDNFVFRWDVSSQTLHVVVTDVEEPNGLAFSPDGSLLYVADSSSVRRPAGVGNRAIRAYEVQDGVPCKNGRVFTTLDTFDGVPDGIRIDEQGRVWSSSASAVIVFDPDGTECERLTMPDVVGNLFSAAKAGPRCSSVARVRFFESRRRFATPGVLNASVKSTALATAGRTSQRLYVGIVPLRRAPTALIRSTISPSSLAPFNQPRFSATWDTREPATRTRSTPSWWPASAWQFGGRQPDSPRDLRYRADCV